jgi:hypothetical protein
MTNSQRLSTVRNLLIRWMTDQVGSPNHQPAGPTDDHPIRSESILIRDGFYCGRRFDLGSHRAVWFLEEDVLKIYTGKGELKCVLSGEQLSVSDDRKQDRAGDQDDATSQVLTLPASSQRPDGVDPRRADTGGRGESRRAA